MPHPAFCRCLPSARNFWAYQIQAVLSADPFVKATVKDTKRGLVVNIAVDHCVTPLGGATRACIAAGAAKAQALSNFLSLSTRAANEHFTTKVIIRVTHDGRVIGVGGAQRSPAAAGQFFKAAMLGNTIFSSVSTRLVCVRFSVVAVRLEGYEPAPHAHERQGACCCSYLRPPTSASTVGELNTLGFRRSSTPAYSLAQVSPACPS
jgi:hypothetical protein